MKEQRLSPMPRGLGFKAFLRKYNKAAWAAAAVVATVNVGFFLTPILKAAPKIILTQSPQQSVRSRAEQHALHQVGVMLGLPDDGRKYSGGRARESSDDGNWSDMIQISVGKDYVQFYASNDIFRYIKGDRGTGTGVVYIMETDGRLAHKLSLKNNKVGSLNDQLPISAAEAEDMGRKLKNYSNRIESLLGPHKLPPETEQDLPGEPRRSVPSSASTKIVL